MRENSEDKDLRENSEDKDLEEEQKPVGFRRDWMECTIRRKCLLSMEPEPWTVSVFSMDSVSNWEAIPLSDMTT